MNTLEEPEISKTILCTYHEKLLDREVFPGLWIAGMSVCATLGGPRMGPIFGGMLLSGKRIADLIASAISHSGDNMPEN